MAHHHSIFASDSIDSQPVVRRIGLADIKRALTLGLDDFLAIPSYAVMLCMVFPVAGFVMARIAFGYSVLPLIYPMAAGFALVGPFAAIGLYEMSRRREQGQPVDWGTAFNIQNSPSFGAIALLGITLLVIFAGWLATAQSLYQSLFGYAAPDSLPQFAQDLFGTSAGWTLIVLGNGIGFLFALVTLMISVISFPLLLDRDVGAAEAVLTSIRAVIANPGPMAIWGLIVTALLIVGLLPAFLGLAVVLPILGHATWHLYRQMIEH